MGKKKSGKKGEGTATQSSATQKVDESSRETQAETLSGTQDVDGVTPATASPEQPKTPEEETGGEGVQVTEEDGKLPDALGSRVTGKQSKTKKKTAGKANLAKVEARLEGKIDSMFKAMLSQLEGVVKKHSNVPKNRNTGRSARTGDRRRFDALNLVVGGQAAPAVSSKSTKSEGKSSTVASGEKEAVVKLQDEAISQENKDYLLNYHILQPARPPQNWGTRIGPQMLIEILSNHRSPSVFVIDTLNEVDAARRSTSKFSEVRRELLFIGTLIELGIRNSANAYVFATSDLGEMILRKSFCMQRWCKTGLWSASNILLNPSRYLLPRTMMKEVEKEEKRDSERYSKRRREGDHAGPGSNKKERPAPRKGAGPSQ